MQLGIELFAVRRTLLAAAVQVAVRAIFCALAAERLVLSSRPLVRCLPLHVSLRVGAWNAFYDVLLLDVGLVPGPRVLGLLLQLRLQSKALRIGLLPSARVEIELLLCQGRVLRKRLCLHLLISCLPVSPKALLGGAVPVLVWAIAAQRTTAVAAAVFRAVAGEVGVRGEVGAANLGIRRVLGHLLHALVAVEYAGAVPLLIALNVLLALVVFRGLLVRVVVGGERASALHQQVLLQLQQFSLLFLE